MGLEALNFAMAGAREGFGPLLGVYLQGVGFDPAATGVAMSLVTGGMTVTVQIVMIAGAAVSPLLAGLVAQCAGFPIAFLALGCVAAAGFVAWLSLWRLATRSDRGTAGATADPARG